MNMSKAVLRQLLGAGLVRAVTGAALGPDATPGVKAICARLDRLAGHATDYAMAGNRKNERGQWVLDARAQRQRQRALQALIREVGLQYETLVDIRDIATTAMLWVEDLRDQLPVAPVDRRITWAEIAGQLQALYEQYDPDGMGGDVIDVAAERGMDFQRVAGVW